MARDLEVLLQFWIVHQERPLWTWHEVWAEYEGFHLFPRIWVSLEYVQDLSQAIFIKWIHPGIHESKYVLFPEEAQLF